MVPFLIRRFGELLFIMIGMSIVVFLIFFATPGTDPAARFAGRGASPEVLAAVTRSFGLDQPLWHQYLVLMRRLFIDHDLTSFVNRGLPVVPTIVQAIPVTFSVAAGAVVIWLVMSLAMGVAASVFHRTLIDRLLMIIGLIGISMPVFWVGQVVLLLAYGRFHDSWFFGWLPPLGYIEFTRSPIGWFKCLVLPWITLSIFYVGLYARILRASLLDTYNRDFIRTARAKGLSESRILVRHALRTSLISYISLFGLDLGALLGGGTVLVEIVFGLPGVGRVAYNALLNLDLPVMLTTVMYASFFVVISSAVVDIVYAVIDPRVRTR